MESGACGEVGIDLPENISAFQFYPYNSPVSGYTLGMTWVSGNRLLLRVGTDYRLYSLEIAPK